MCVLSQLSLVVHLTMLVSLFASVALTVLGAITPAHGLAIDERATRVMAERSYQSGGMTCYCERTASHM